MAGEEVGMAATTCTECGPNNPDMKRFDLLTKEELIPYFGAANYAVFAAMLLISAAIGAFFWWKGQKSTEEFLMASKSMGTLPMTLSLVASFMSAITLLGTPAEMYVSGTQYAALVLAYPLVMGATAHGFLPVFDRLQVATSYQYLHLRFGLSVRILGSICFAIQMVMYMAIVVYAPALALEQVTGFPLDIAVVVIFLVCIFYTAVGGIKAVMWTDTFQALCMFGSFLAIIIKGNFDAGGASKVFDTNYQSGRVELFNFSADPRERHTVWSLVVGGFFTWLSVYGINQTQVQRYMTVRKRSDAVKAIWLNVLGIGSLLLLCGYGGLVMYAYYHDCDPIKTRQVAKKDQLFPLFVMQVMREHPGVPGLFVAGVFSGALSTVSSGLNSLAAVTLRDFIQAGCGVSLSEARATLVTKLLAVGFGVISYVVVFMVKYLPGVLEAALGIFGIMGGPVLGAFVLGMFVPYCNQLGAFVGTLTSLIFTMWMGFGQTVAKQAGTYDGARWGRKFPTSTANCPPSWNVTLEAAGASAPSGLQETFLHLELYEVSYMYFSAVACVWCVVVGALVSLVRPVDHRTLDPRLISPALPHLFALWPAPVRRWIRRVMEEVGTARRTAKEGAATNMAMSID